MGFMFIQWHLSLYVMCVNVLSLSKGTRTFWTLLSLFALTTEYLVDSQHIYSYLSMPRDFSLGLRFDPGGQRLRRKPDVWIREPWCKELVNELETPRTMRPKLQCQSWHEKLRFSKENKKISVLASAPRHKSWEDYDAPGCCLFSGCIVYPDVYHRVLYSGVIRRTSSCWISIISGLELRSFPGPPHTTTTITYTITKSLRTDWDSFLI